MLRENKLNSYSTTANEFIAYLIYYRFVDTGKSGSEWNEKNVKQRK